MTTRKFKKGDSVLFEATDEFTGKVYPVWARVISKANENSNVRNNPEYMEVGDDDYIVYSDDLKRSFLVSAFEILDKK